MVTGTNKADNWGEVRPVPGLGYEAFYPAPLPRSIGISPSILQKLTNAEAALGRLAGAGRLLPNPHLLIRAYVLREAMASTRIEGTQTTLTAVLDSTATGTAPDADVEEVTNYVRALESGLARLSELPLGTRLMCEMHSILLDGVRGRDRQPGEIRRSQNWIGRPGATLERATFVPPPPDEVPPLLADWERFAHEDSSVPVLIQSALLHHQFETIHPFLDGNGRLGRLLIILHLVMCGRLPSPLLYLSSYFENHKDTYIGCLQGVREGNGLDPWLDFYLSGIEAEASDALRRAEQVVALREDYRQRLSGSTRSQAISVIDHLFDSPIVTARTIEKHLGVSRPTALRTLDRLSELGIVTESAPGPRNMRRFVASEILALLETE